MWLEDFALPDDLWARFGIPIGLAFFMFSTVTQCVVAMYPSPAGATESELHFEAWSELVALNPALCDLEPDGEALIVNRLSDPPAFAIAPIDRCYELVGLVRSTWEGISGGDRARGGRRALLRRPARGGRMSAAPEPEFAVLGATGRRHAAVPALDFDVSVSEPGGRSIYAIALTVQVMIEPARRRYDDETRDRWSSSSAPPDRWATTTRSLVWHRADVLVPSFTGSTIFHVPIPCSYDLELVAAKYFYSLDDGEVAAGLQLQRDGHLPRRGRPRADVAGAVELLGRVPAARCRPGAS